MITLTKELKKIVDDWWKAWAPDAAVPKDVTACRALHRTHLDATAGGVLVEKLQSAIHQRVQAAPTKRVTGRKNWAWRSFETGGTDPEEKLGRMVVELGADSDGACNWAYEIPTCSGFPGGGGKKVAIDLAHRLAGGVFELIELKVKSDNPLYAATEIARYGSIYLYSRAHATVLEYSDLELLDAQEIRLQVLAPNEFYIDKKSDKPYLLADLQRTLNAGFEAAGRRNGLRMGFAFCAFEYDGNYVDNSARRIIQGKTICPPAAA